MLEIEKSVVPLEYGEYCDGCASKECCMVCVLRSKIDKLEQQLKEANEKIKCCGNCRHGHKCDKWETR